MNIIAKTGVAATVLVLALSLTLLTPFFAPEATTQEVTPEQAEVSAHNHDDHSGHAHATQKGGQDVAVTDIDFVFTESPDDHVIGADDAPVTIIGYVSVMCSHCEDWFTHQWSTFKSDLIDSGKARFVLREVPTPPQNLAMMGFLIANCAPEDQYFDHVVHQMQNRSKILKSLEAGEGKATYDGLARMAGLEDDAAVNACFADPEGVARIDRSVTRARAAKFTGVPAFYINGEMFKGDADAEALALAVNRLSDAGVTKMP